MTKLKLWSRVVKDGAFHGKAANWFPGHMYSGMKAMMGKLSSVDCVIEVHDARIPMIGRNKEFKSHLGTIKPHLLVLNKADLADLSDWKTVKYKLEKNGDKNVILTHLKGDQTSLRSEHTSMMDMAVKIVNQNDRLNRTSSDYYKIMIVGIPNVGKSTLTNRLRQYHLGIGGQATKTGALAGVTRAVENKVLVCARPKIYTLDTPGVLQPSTLSSMNCVGPMALCSTISDGAVEPTSMIDFMLTHMKRTGNEHYRYYLEIDKPVENIHDLITGAKKFYESKYALVRNLEASEVNYSQIDVCWKLIADFRKGMFGKFMFI